VYFPCLHQNTRVNGANFVVNSHKTLVKYLKIIVRPFKRACTALFLLGMSEYEGSQEQDQLKFVDRSIRFPISSGHLLICKCSLWFPFCTKVLSILASLLPMRMITLWLRSQLWRFRKKIFLCYFWRITLNRVTKLWLFPIKTSNNMCWNKRAVFG